jgi:tRNA dimethylallyltransferase
MSNQPVIFLMGPTASGKTDIAIQLVQSCHCEIISVDSAMVYRDMDIGTAKPSAEELAIAPHHLINLCDPSEAYSVGRFCRDAQQAIEHVKKKGKIPLLVGGTMLYFYQLRQGFNDMPATDENIRKQLTAEAEQIGWPALHEKLVSCDPASAEQIHPNDAQRISRALEVFYSSGKTLTQWKKTQQLKPLSEVIVPLILSPVDRSVLHQRIALRFDQMLEQGFEQEVLALFERDDMNQDLPSMKSVGYRQMWAYLAGDLDQATMRERAIIATRQLAKRQLTWLRRWHDAKWFDSLDNNTFKNIRESIVKYG